MLSEVFILITNKIEECQKDKVSLFIVDAAMIFEEKLSNFFDSTLLVTANKNLRLKRAEKRHNIPLEQIKNRMSLQFSERKKEKLATHIIRNNGDLIEDLTGDKSLGERVNNKFSLLVSSDNLGDNLGDEL